MPYETRNFACSGAAAPLARLRRGGGLPPAPQAELGLNPIEALMQQVPIEYRWEDRQLEAVFRFAFADFSGELGAEKLSAVTGIELDGRERGDPSEYWVIIHTADGTRNICQYGCLAASAPDPAYTDPAGGEHDLSALGLVSVMTDYVRSFADLERFQNLDSLFVLDSRAEDFSVLDGLPKLKTATVFSASAKTYEKGAGR